MPFTDENAPKVFSRPVLKSESASAPAPAFTPLVEKDSLPKQSLSSSASNRPVLGERAPLRAVFAPPQPDPEPEHDQPADEAQEQGSSQPDTPTTESESDALAREQFELERQQSRDPLTSESSEDVDDYSYEDDPAEDHRLEISHNVNPRKGPAAESMWNTPR